MQKQEKQTSKQVPFIRLDLHGNIVSAELITVPSVAPNLREYRNVDAQLKHEYWILRGTSPLGKGVQ